MLAVEERTKMSFQRWMKVINTRVKGILDDTFWLYYIGETFKYVQLIVIWLYKLLFNSELQKSPFGTYVNVHLAKFWNFIII